MAWLVWIDKWHAGTSDYIEEAELVFDTEENALAYARWYLADVKAGERAQVQVVELWNEDHCVFDETVEVA